MAKFLVLNFFPAFNPPLSGGEMRVSGLYSRLSEKHEVTLLTSTGFGARYEEIRHSDSFKEIRFPKDVHWQNAYRTLQDSGLTGELSGLAFALAVADTNCNLRLTARKLAKRADFIVHEFPFSEPIFSDGIFGPEIYNSHNFEASLLSAIAHGAALDKAILKLMRLEGNLAHRARRVFATSRADAAKFAIFYNIPPEKISICPNGYDEAETDDILDLRRDLQDSEVAARPRVCFLGSAHYPNVEAARQLYAIAEKVPEADFIVAGGVCAQLDKRQAPPNLTLAGPISADEKRRLLAGTTLFVNPVVLGSGTSLKSVEVLASGIPMLTTQEGIRGLSIDVTRAAIVANRSEFAPVICQLIGDIPGLQTIGIAGREEIQRSYSWRAIAEQLDHDLSLPPFETEMTEALTLFLNDYDIGRGESGGSARIRSLVSLHSGNKVLVSFGTKFDVELISEKAIKIIVPKTAAHASFEQTVAEGHAVSANDIVGALFAPSNYLLRRITKEFARRADVIVFEHCYMASLIDVVKNVNNQALIVYSSHNVEAKLKADLLLGHRSQSEMVSFVSELENELSKVASLVVCVTEADATYFRLKGLATLICQNGCHVPYIEERKSFDEHGSGLICGFVGSSHGPNVDAAEFICRVLAPRFPDITFEFIGSVCSAINKSLPPNVLLLGVLSDYEKTKAMLRWYVALNPVNQGGGSSLKLPDYLAHGLASINTKIGARGFRVHESRSGIVVPRSKFAQELSSLVRAPEIVRKFSNNARSYAEQELTWKAVGSEYVRYIDNSRRPSEKRARASLLVVTYRYTEPPRGGAEEYLVELLKEIRDDFEWVDLVAIDIDEITNSHHFGTRVVSSHSGGSSRLGELFDQQFYFSPSTPSLNESLAASQALELAWKYEELTLYLQFARILLRDRCVALLGGFYDVERSQEGLRRWTSPRFAIAVSAKCSRISLQGFASRPKRASITVCSSSGQVIANYDFKLESWFRKEFDLTASPLIEIFTVHIEVPSHQSDNDHRTFGVYIEKIQVTRSDGGKIVDCDLSANNDQLLSIDRLDSWMTALETTALTRDKNLDILFSHVRGPNSSSMLEWIREYSLNYSHVIVQGIPFNTIPSVVNILDEIGYAGRIVTLPHFHGDDRFYYWRDYLNAFARADDNLFFSKIVADHMGKYGPSRVVPGGGVSVADLGSPTCKENFGNVHRRDRPFYLILGRKTASKGYESAIRAYLASTRYVEYDLVIIGRDEDKVDINTPGVYYLGAQPRDVVIGALTSCVGLVSMSTSESFGIVLCEAWLFGKPVIANAACYSFRELIEQCEGGILVDSEDALTAAMDDLFFDEPRRVALGQNGFASVLAHYTWPAVASRVMEDFGGQIL